MNITKEIQLAIDIMHDLKNEKDYVKLITFAEKHNTSEAFVKKIVGKLSKNSLIEGKKGTNGGIKRPSVQKEISALDVIKAFKKVELADSDSKSITSKLSMKVLDIYKKTLL